MLPFGSRHERVKIFCGIYIAAPSTEDKKVNKTGLAKRLLACSLAVITAITVMAGAQSPLLNEEPVMAASQEAKEKEAEINAAKEKIAALEEKQKELDQKISDTKDDLSAEKENQAAIEEQIETVQQTILALDESIKELEGKIKELSDSIAQKELQISNKKKEIETGVDEFKQRIRAMYVAGSESYTDILIGASDFYDMLMKIELVKRVADHDNDMIDNLVDLKKQFEADEVALQEEKAEFEANKADLEAQQKKQQEQKDKLDVLYSESQAMIEKLEKDEEIYTANQEQAQKEQDDFEAELQQLYKEQEAIKQKEEEERRRKEEEARRQAEEEARRKAEEEARRKAEEEAAKNQQQNNSGNSGSSSGNSGQTSTDNSDYNYTDKSMFTWPVPGYYYISSGVGWRWGAYHSGIDICSANGTIRGANICAAADGTVIRVENYCPHDYGKNGSCGCGGGYGRYCIIDHGNGWWTLYGHSEGILVSVGQQVKQGDILGTVGSTGFSTGPHLHFEVRKDGVALNPSDYV